jgi:hypothetical protein
MKRMIDFDRLRITVSCDIALLSPEQKIRLQVLQLEIVGAKNMPYIDAPLHGTHQFFVEY